MCDYYTKEEAIEQMNKVYSIASQKVQTARHGTSMRMSGGGRS